jgi:DNA-binding LacI/PurR family transcriptional regulator/DNA-binding transcriptional regulator YhcF (GntR family)
MAHVVDDRTDPVYRKIKRHLGFRLGEQWPAGMRLPPISELARELGAGQRNTHRAVQELVEDGFLISRPGLGTLVAPDLDTRKVRQIFGRERPSAPIATSRLLAGKRVELLTQVLSPEEMVLRMIDAATESLRVQGATVATQVVPFERLHALGELDADAVMLFNIEAPVTCGPEQVLSVVTTAGPVVVAMGGRFDVVSVDQEQGGFLAGEHARLFNSEVCFLGVRHRDQPGEFDPTSAGRLAGFQHGLGRRLPAAMQLMDEAYDYWAGSRMMGRWFRLPQRPPLVFAASDDLAIGFIIAAQSYDLHPGVDYHIIGFDGQRIGRKIASGALTTVRVPAEQMGARAAQLLGERLLDPDQSVRRLHLGCDFFAGRTALPPAISDSSGAKP